MLRKVKQRRQLLTWAERVVLGIFLSLLTCYDWVAVVKGQLYLWCYVDLDLDVGSYLDVGGNKKDHATTLSGVISGSYLALACNFDPYLLTLQCICTEI